MYINVITAVWYFKPGLTPPGTRVCVPHTHTFKLDVLRLTGSVCFCGGRTGRESTSVFSAKQMFISISERSCEAIRLHYQEHTNYVGTGGVGGTHEYLHIHVLGLKRKKKNNPNNKQTSGFEFSELRFTCRTRSSIDRAGPGPATTHATLHQRQLKKT